MSCDYVSVMKKMSLNSLKIFILIPSYVFVHSKLKQHKPRMTETAVNINPVILGYIQCANFKTIIVYSPVALGLKAFIFCSGS